MKHYIPLVLITIIIAFATGRTSYLLFRNRAANSDDIALINSTKTNFRRNVSPKAIINFYSLYGTEARKELLDPNSIVIGTDSDGSDYYSTSISCKSYIPADFDNRPYKKAWIWEEFRCYRLRELPSHFFGSVPFMHPSGHSYAWLAIKMKGRGFHNFSWVKKNKENFHVNELKFLIKDYPHLGSFYSFLSTLDRNDLKELKSAERSILTKKYFLSKIHYPDFFSMLEYEVYEKSQFIKYLKQTPFRIKSSNRNSECLFKEGRLCWNYHLGHMLKEANKRTFVTIIVLIIIISFFVSILISKIKNQKLEEERKKLALQVLTHEFRTPVASLLLGIERLNKRMGRFDEDVQEIILQLSDQTYRLKRLTEKSRHYLHLQNTKKLINLQIEELPSVNEFMEGFVEPYKISYTNDELKLTLLKKDQTLSTDIFWLGICLKNLVGNAISHGCIPISVSVNNLSHGFVEFVVVDAGDCPFKTLKEMTGEFVKGGQSKGSGLGLNIVQKVIKNMGGKFEFYSNPTTFKLILGGKKDV